MHRPSIVIIIEHFSDDVRFKDCASHSRELKRNNNLLQLPTTIRQEDSSGEVVVALVVIVVGRAVVVVVQAPMALPCRTASIIAPRMATIALAATEVGLEV